MKGIITVLGIIALMAVTPAVATAPTDTPTDRIAALFACTHRVFEDGSVVNVDVDPDFPGGPAMSPRCANWVGHYIGNGTYGRDRTAILRKVR